MIVFGICSRLGAGRLGPPARRLPVCSNVLLPAKLFFLASTTVYALVILRASGEGAKCPVPIYGVAVPTTRRAHISAWLSSSHAGVTRRGVPRARPCPMLVRRSAWQAARPRHFSASWIYCTVSAFPGRVSQPLEQPLIYSFMLAVNQGDCRPWRPMIFQQTTPECWAQKSPPGCCPRGLATDCETMSRLQYRGA